MKSNQNRVATEEQFRTRRTNSRQTRSFQLHRVHTLRSKMFDALSITLADGRRFANARQERAFSDRLLTGAIGVMTQRVKWETIDRSAEQRVFFDHVMEMNFMLLIEDVHSHPLVRYSQLDQKRSIGSYLGAPIHDASGISIGVASIVDFRRRAWSTEQIDAVAEAAREVEIFLTDGRE